MKYNVKEISLEYDPSYLATRAYIRYEQNGEGGDQIICMLLSEKQMAGMSNLSTMQYISEKAANHMKDPEFYSAMRHYFVKGHQQGKYEPFKIDNKHKDHVHWTPTVVKKYDAQKNLVTYEYEDKLTTIGNKLLQGAIQPVDSDPGPDMKQIDALPGINEKVKHPVDGDVRRIKEIIISLNDKHHWSREKVADWLETLDVDLTFKTPDAILKEKEKALLDKKIAVLTTNIKTVEDNLSKLKKNLEEATLKMIELEATFNEQS